MLDDDGRGNSDIHIRATVTKRGSDLTIDLSDSHEQVTSFINSSYPNMYSSVVVALSYLIDPRHAEERRHLPPARRSSPSRARWCGPTPARRSPWRPIIAAQEIIEAIIKALAPACPDRAMAGWGRRFRIAIQGKDPRSDKPFIWHFFQARPGGGASPAGDGWPGAGEWQAAGGIKFGSLEVTEVRFPLFFRRHEFRPDSGGDGQISRRSRRGRRDGRRDRRAGGRQHRRRRRAPRRLRHPRRRGRRCRIAIRSIPEGRPPRAIKTKEVGLVIHPDDVLVLESGGGGGWGDPGRARPRCIASDIENGFVTDDRLPSPTNAAAGWVLPLPQLQARSPTPSRPRGG